ncbi:alpha/beta hydrolase [Pararhizobium arenae]|uniref:alpha/beta hydrolase n=1 Tax=Pararhizobium arenae TaxID=1856850 RepID=UPI00094B0EED|nr:alpha/beta hydrolase [Pararhizobium arenae]
MAKRQDAQRSPLSDPKETIHITLIHGTFAPGAAWTKPGSLFRNTISEEFDGRIEFHSDFWWWGLPSHLNRHVAGMRLQKYLWDLTTSHPGRHFVIGHSHGALVGLYAVRDQDLAKRIEGVISLSTPFLIARPRELSILGMIALIFGFIAFFAIPASFAPIPFAAYIDSELPWYLGAPIFLVGLALPVVGLMAIAGIIIGVEKLTNWFLTTMKIPNIHSGRLLIVRGPSDEASALISLFHGLELLVTAIWGRRGPFDRFILASARRLSNGVERILNAVPMWFCAISWAWFWLGNLLTVVAFMSAAIFSLNFPEQTEEIKRTAWAPFNPRSHLWPMLGIIYHYSTAVLPFWLISAIAITAFPTFIFLCLTGFAFSLAVSAGVFLGLCFLVAVSCTAFLAITSVPELGPCAATVVVSVEATPPGRYEVESGDDTARIDAFLTHSWSYSHPQALAAISAWLKLPKPDAPLIPPLPEPKTQSENPFS